jgi:hypothetical protein
MSNNKIIIVVIKNFRDFEIIYDITFKKFILYLIYHYFFNILCYINYLELYNYIRTKRRNIYKYS